jgi:hypothetical protein
MAVTVALQNLGDAAVCWDLSAKIEHGFSDRRGPWRVSITGSRASQDWELLIEGPNGFERSYVLAGAASEHEPDAVYRLIAKLVSASPRKPLLAKTANLSWEEHPPFQIDARQLASPAFFDGSSIPYRAQIKTDRGLIPSLPHGHKSPRLKSV